MARSKILLEVMITQTFHEAFWNSLNLEGDLKSETSPALPDRIS